MLGIRAASVTRRFNVSLKLLIRNASGSSLLSGPDVPPSPRPRRILFSPLTVPARHASSSSGGGGGGGGDGDAGSPGWYGAIADSNPVHLTEQLLISSHAATGLPWWATIMCTTLALRTVVTLPLGAYQMVIIGKVHAT